MEYPRGELLVTDQELKQHFDFMLDILPIERAIGVVHAGGLAMLYAAVTTYERDDGPLSDDAHLRIQQAVRRQHGEGTLFESLFEEPRGQLARMRRRFRVWLNTSFRIQKGELLAAGPVVRKHW